MEKAKDDSASMCNTGTAIDCIVVDLSQISEHVREQTASVFKMYLMVD